MLKSTIKRFLNHFGYDIQHIPTDRFSREQMWLFHKHGIDLVFDIGANEGQYAKRLLKLGYKGKIVSFEPLPDAYKKLAAASANERNWTVVNTALGNSTGEVTLNISKNSYSSSILDILPAHLESAPGSEYSGQVKVPITTIDSLLTQYYKSGQNLFVKIDTQGYEKRILEGSVKSLCNICGFQMELSLIPLYQEETLMQEMVAILRDKGYRLMILESGHYNYETGEILQVEGIFYKSIKASNINP